MEGWMDDFLKKKLDVISLHLQHNSLGSAQAADSLIQKTAG